MSDKKILAEHHRFQDDLRFYVKSRVLIGIRFFKNTFAQKVRRFPVDDRFIDHPVIASSETDLWNADDTGGNWILTAGKIQNLRVAAKRLHGLEIPAHQTFSFWKHIGVPSRWKGYVVGREIREGCIVPVVAGGLCQLSNAMYDTALKAGFEIIERHRHTKVIRGSLAEIDRDATVKWNYIDLQFRSQHPFRIEVDLEADKLVVRFKSVTSVKKNAATSTIRPTSELNDCFSCGNFACHKHPHKTNKGRIDRNVTTFILDEKWREHEKFVEETASASDHLIAPFITQSRFKIGRYSWNTSKFGRFDTTPVVALYRSLRLRLAAKRKENIFSVSLNMDALVAKKMIRHIPVACTHLVISQNLLPFIWRTGALGGRTFDVLMTRLPMQKLHERLDSAHKKFPESVTLNDFRAPEDLVRSENIALTHARKIITPHREIADLFNNKSILLDWNFPGVDRRNITGKKILFPASSLARKGSYEVRRLAKELDLTIVVTRDAMETDHFWGNLKIEKAGADIFADIQMVVYPAYVEHQPRLLLRAIALGVPVIATDACGLHGIENVKIISAGDYEGLKACVTKLLEPAIA